MDLVNQFCLADHVNLLGEVSNVSDVYPSFDLVVSSSKSESFGLTVLEALLSGVNASTINLPVIDELLGEYSTNEGLIDNKEMAVRWLEKADISPSQELKQLISDHYSLQNMLDSYSILYKSFVR
jgi:glycosyltransferase involved in cell wall biosynthesis